MTDLAEDVFESIHAVMHLYRSRQYRILRDGPHELTHMENKVLGFFHRHPGATLSDLVIYSGRDKAQVARLIKSLKDRAFLEGQAAKSDRRSVMLRLTAAGEAVHRALQEQGRFLSGIAVSGLSEDECRTLVSLLDRIRHNLDEPA
ncbi:MarR family winged helix-turn-helix transcriptional regulator [Stutzerimonas tarimensis]|uniref:MarR family winged helix-turn-helix transcriptional regulator n=1 Tax=Stutzerimonas tarimensis TaxID=1507735 RepID=A0ABV7T3U3_9GAMM